MPEYIAPHEWPFIPANAVPLAGTFLLPVCTTRERLLKLLTALNVWKNLDHDNDDYDPISDIVSAIPYIQDPLSSPCVAVSGNDCVDYPTGYARIIEWIPNNPHADVQPEYDPWYKLAANNDITGQRAGDILADLTTIGVDPLMPMPDPAPEFPRYRVTITGTGSIELHMVSIPLGGMAQVQVDGDLLQVTYVDLNQDFASVPPELYSTVIWEHEFTTGGEHFIDVTLIPRMNDEATAFVGWGGGLRKIVLCGFDEAPRVPMFRFTEECGLEYRYAESEEWLPVAGWDEFAATCFEGPAGPAGADGAAGPAGPAGADGAAGPAGYDDDGDVPVPTGTASEDKRCNVATAIADGILGRYDDWLTAWIAVLADNANNFNDAFLELQSDAQTALAVGLIPAGVTQNALPFIAGTVLADILGIGAVIAGIGAYFAGKDVLNWIQVQDDIGDPVFRQDLICLIAASIDTNGDLTAERWSDIRGGITALDGASADARQDFVDFLNQSVPVAIARVYALSPAAGDCDPCFESDHYYKWDFTTSAGDWVLSLGDGVAGTWVDGEGYKSTLRTSTGSIADELRMHRGFTTDFSRKLKRIAVDMEFTRGEVEFPAAQRGEISIKDPSASSTLFLRNVSFNEVIVETKDVFFRSNMQLIALASYENSTTPSPRGNVVFRGLRVWYDGADANFTGGTGY